MIIRELCESFFKTAKEEIVRIIVGLFLSAIALLVTFCTPIKDKLVEHPSVLLVLVAAMVIITVFCLIWMIQIYLRYGRYKEAFGVFWDKNHNMRCLSCKKPLKNSSTDESMFYCADRKCDSRHVLRDANGAKMTRADAIAHLG